jgi:hypothetical protein
MEDREIDLSVGMKGLTKIAKSTINYSSFGIKEDDPMILRTEVQESIRCLIEPPSDASLSLR